MKADTIIIGGGLSGLICGIHLQQSGQKVIIISSGQSSLHFNSGSLEILGQHDGNVVTEPFKAMESLAESHPYSKIRRQNVEKCLGQAMQIITGAGLGFKGGNSTNHFRITPIGELKPAWLTLDDYPVIENPARMPWSKVAIVNLNGYLDFFPTFIARGLAKYDVASTFATVTTGELDKLRKSPSEMRATNIARTLTGDGIAALAQAVNSAVAESGVDAILMPAVLGIDNSEDIDRMRQSVRKPLHFITTMPTTVSGVRMHTCLRTLFERHGGIFLPGDSVTSGIWHDNTLDAVKTCNLGDTVLSARDFILATGSFVSRGLIAGPDSVTEPTFGLDVDTIPERAGRFDKDIYSPQPYMRSGVRTDSCFRTSRDGSACANLYAVGSVLSGFDALKEGSGAGVALSSAIHVANSIINS